MNKKHFHALLPFLLFVLQCYCFFFNIVPNWFGLCHWYLDSEYPSTYKTIIVTLTYEPDQKKCLREKRVKLKRELALS